MSQELDINTDIQVPQVSDDGVADLMRQAEAMSAAHKLATVLCNTSMVPATFRGKPDDGAAAILYGAEVGLKPQQALQQVFVVHGQPAIYARTMAALLKAKGYTFSTVETSDTSVTVEGHSPRGEREISTWTIDRAKKAGYTSNKKYQSDPQAMLYAKALSEVARKLAPDVLLGIKYAAEDLELEPVKMTATREDVAAQALAAPAPKKKQERNFAEELAGITDPGGLQPLMADAQAALSEAEYEELAQAANAKWIELNEEEA
ncbi:hypothetical protein [Corynebacterium striatum]|uniref:hypothetical protein n=1 Tax=Corynebacterium striatum TaxID=43770 RepID=UPI000D76CD0B|nr:hypothetical protein [Corynebacterium striatum]PXY12793.1 hypothetical protein CKF74_07330 [Corynebacterium striatum]